MSEILVVVAAPEAGPVTEAITPNWVTSIPAAAAPRWPWSVRTVLYSLGAGVDTESPATAARTWEIMPTVADASIVHVCRPYTPAGEVAVLAAKLLGKALVVSDLAPSTSSLGRSFGLLDLSDVIICGDENEARPFAQGQDVEIVDFTVDTWSSHLQAIYGQLMAGRRGPA